MRSEIWNYVSAVMAPKILAIHQLYDNLMNRLESAETRVDTAIETMQQTLDTRLTEFQTFVDTSISNFQTTLSEGLTSIRTTLFDALNQDTIQNGLTTSPRITPDASNYGLIQRYTINRTTVTIDMPILPDGSTAISNITLIIDTSQNSCVVTLGSGLSFEASGGDGSILLKGQLYSYSIIVLSTTEAYVETRLLHSP